MKEHPLHEPEERESLNAVGGHCPRCGTEYRPGFHVYADCGVPLIPGPAPVPSEDEPDDQSWLDEESETRPVSVASLPWEEAWLLAGRLRTEGVPARVYPDEPGGPIVAGQGFPVSRELMGDIGIGRTSFDVMVPEQYQAPARRIVARYVHA